MQQFDLIVIGSGSGLDVANAAAQHGMCVAVIEKGRMGGTCLNRGCIPSKLLIHSADIAETVKTAELFGIKVEGFSVDFEKIVSRVNGIVDSESDGIRNAFSEIDNPKLFPHRCRFIGEKTISLGEGETTIMADKILIASGTRPSIPNIKGLQGSGFITSDEALRLKKQPRTLTIIGGGYIAAELAHFFGALGTEINIVQRRNLLIPNEDEEVARKFTELFSKKYNVYLGYNVESVSKEEKEKGGGSSCDDDNDNAGGTFRVTAKNPSLGKSVTLESDQLLVATGRVPNSDTLDIAKTGVKVDEKGFVIVDKYLETNVKGIFALGDAVGRYQFKHSANLEAQYAFNNIVHPDKKVPVDYTAMPHAIFSWPQVAGVGYTEQELMIKKDKKTEENKKETDYAKLVYPYIKTAMGEAIEDRDGFVKFLVSRNDGRILGCHIIGSHASILIHEVLVAMKAGPGTVDGIARTVHIHPALSEVVARAAFASPS